MKTSRRLKPFSMKLLSLALGLSIGLLASHANAASFDEVMSSRLSPTEYENLLLEMKANGITENDLNAIQVEIDSQQKKIEVAAAAPQQEAHIRNLIFAGLQLGSLFPIGGEGTFMQMRGSESLWSIDIRIEPSAYLNSLSVGGAYHPFQTAFFAGARLRQLFLHSPFSRGYDSETDAALGLGAETGFRWRLGENDSVLLSVSLGATKAVSSALDLPVMMNVNAGVAIRIFEIGK